MQPYKERIKTETVILSHVERYEILHLKHSTVTPSLNKYPLLLLNKVLPFNVIQISCLNLFVQPYSLFFILSNWTAFYCQHHHFPAPQTYDYWNLMHLSEPRSCAVSTSPSPREPSLLPWTDLTLQVRHLWYLTLHSVTGLVRTRFRSMSTMPAQDFATVLNLEATRFLLLFYIKICWLCKPRWKEMYVNPRGQKEWRKNNYTVEI